MQQEFKQEIIDKLKSYVYRLIDPRNGETFYIGKGKGNRVFAHIRTEEGLEGDDIENKLIRIRLIKAAGLEVSHVIHRHGMDETTALQVEAALIDAYPGLTNIASGIGANSFGVMHAEEVIRQYTAEQAVFKHKAILININISISLTSIYEATRKAWKLNKSKAEKAEIVLAVEKGLIRAAFIPECWLDVTAENFPGAEAEPGRIGFIGIEAPDEIVQLYVGKRVPDSYRKKGAANPVRYTW